MQKLMSFSEAYNSPNALENDIMLHLKSGAFRSYLDPRIKMHTISSSNLKVYLWDLSVEKRLLCSLFVSG